MTEPDCQRSPQLMCPYCGYIDRNSWEYGTFGESFTIECGNEECERQFDVCREIEVYWSTFKKNEADHGAE